MEKLPVVEQFLSFQGEGHNAGMPAWFVRLAGCNVGCAFCDEKRSWALANSKMVFVEDILQIVLDSKVRNLIVTGGEPTLYDLNNLTTLAKEKGINTFLETSGVNEITGKWNWICLSPKQNKLPLDSSLSIANELKVVIENNNDLSFAENMRAKVSDSCKCYLQAQWTEREKALKVIEEFIFSNPFWHLSTQTHKYLNIK